MQPNPTRVVLIALATVLGVCVMLAIAPVQDPLDVDLASRLDAPSASHWLGTDELGRDVLSRVVRGTALTISIAVGALVTSLAVGVLLGAVAGYYYKKWPDRLISWVGDFLMSVPFLVVIVAVLSVTGPGLAKAYLVLAAIIWVGPARIVRSEVIRTLPLAYVSAERVIGTPEWRILLVTVMPACLDSAVLFAISYLPEIVALEAGLSFLGLGVQPPDPSLGKMIFDGVGYLGVAWWLALFPAGALLLVVAGIQAASWYARLHRLG